MSCTERWVKNGSSAFFRQSLEPMLKRKTAAFPESKTGFAVVLGAQADDSADLHKPSIQLTARASCRCYTVRDSAYLHRAGPQQSRQVSMLAHPEDLHLLCSLLQQLLWWKKTVPDIAGHASPPRCSRLRKASPAAWSCNPQQGCRRLLRQPGARRTQRWQASASAAAGANASQPSQQAPLLAAAAAIMVRLWQQALAGLAAGMQRLRTAPDAEQAEVGTPLSGCLM